MDAQLLLSGVIFGLSIGSIFFLMAIGLSLCFGLMRIISLDQLLYYSVGAYLTYSVSLLTGNVWLGEDGSARHVPTVAARRGTEVGRSGEPSHPARSR